MPCRPVEGLRSRSYDVREYEDSGCGLEITDGVGSEGGGVGPRGMRGTEPVRERAEGRAMRSLVGEDLSGGGGAGMDSGAGIRTGV